MNPGNISLNDVETVKDPVSGRVTFVYELGPSQKIEASSIVELVLKIKAHYEEQEFDHGQAD